MLHCHLLVKQLAPGTVLQALLLPWSVLQLVKPAVKVAMVMVRQASGMRSFPCGYRSDGSVVVEVLVVVEVVVEVVVLVVASVSSFSEVIKAAAVAVADVVVADEDLVKWACFKS